MKEYHIKTYRKQLDLIKSKKTRKRGLKNINHQRGVSNII